MMILRPFVLCIDAVSYLPPIAWLFRGLICPRRWESYGTTGTTLLSCCCVVVAVVVARVGASVPIGRMVPNNLDDGIVDGNGMLVIMQIPQLLGGKLIVISSTVLGLENKEAVAVTQKVVD